MICQAKDLKESWEIVIVDASDGRLDHIRLRHETEVRWVQFRQPPGVRVSIPHQRNAGVWAASWRDHRIHRRGLPAGARMACSACRPPPSRGGGHHSRPDAIDAGEYRTIRSRLAASSGVSLPDRVCHDKSRLPPPRPSPLSAVSTKGSLTAPTLTSLGVLSMLVTGSAAFPTQ